MVFFSKHSDPKCVELKKDFFSSLSSITSHDPKLRKDKKIKILEVGVGTGRWGVHVLCWSYVQLMSSLKFYIYTRMHLDINNTFPIEFDPSWMILTFISVPNAYIIRRYPHHPQQAWGPVGMQGSWGKMKYNDLCYKQGASIIYATSHFILVSHFELLHLLVWRVGCIWRLLVLQIFTCRWIQKWSGTAARKANWWHNGALYCIEFPNWCNINFSYK